MGTKKNRGRKLGRGDSNKDLVQSDVTSRRTVVEKGSQRAKKGTGKLEAVKENSKDKHEEKGRVVTQAGSRSASSANGEPAARLGGGGSESSSALERFDQNNVPDWTIAKTE